MKFTDICYLQLGLAVLSVAVGAANLEKVNKRQVGAQKAVVLDSSEDRAAEASDFLGAASDHHHHHHSKYFQDFFTVQLAPHRIEFGHVCEDPNDWEERYERKDFKDNRDQGKVRWGDKHGGYGEHYWDYNHAGHGDSHDEGSEPVAEYQTYKEEEQNRKKRQPNAAAAGLSLVLDPVSGEIIDKISGKKFVLQPIN